jgi:hypothetical protein
MPPQRRDQLAWSAASVKLVKRKPVLFRATRLGSMVEVPAASSATWRLWVDF